MSNIPRARRCLETALSAKRMTKAEMRSFIGLALRMMRRKPWLSHARHKPQPKITPAMGRTIRAMIKSKQYTQAEIATKLGLRRPGRISEFLHRGK